MTEIRNAYNKLNEMYYKDYDRFSLLLDDVAKTVTVRTYDEYGSKDVKRESTDDEYVIIRKLAFGALYTFIHANENTLDITVQTIADMAEITAMKLLENVSNSGFYEGEVDETHINCYDTIYNPLKRLMGAL